MHQVYLYALLTAQLLWWECWGSEPQWPLIYASFSLPPLAHIGVADWGNSAWKVAAPFFLWLADQQHNQPHNVPPSSESMKQKIQPLALCVCIPKKKGDISIKLDYPYSLVWPIPHVLPTKVRNNFNPDTHWFSRTVSASSVPEKDRLRWRGDDNLQNT